MKSLLYSTLLVLLVVVLPAGAHAQNTCSTAVFLDVMNDTQVSASTVGVASDNASSGAQPCGLALGTGGQKWYQFTFTGCSPAPLRLMTCMASNMTNFDTQIHVYTGTCGNLTCVAQDDDSGCELTSDLTFTANPGVTYRVRVGGYGSASGTFYLNTVLNYGGCTDPAACNYSSWAEWDNCSCYYGTMAELTTTVPPALGSGGYVSVYDGMTQVEGANLGTTTYFCEEDFCGLNLIFYLPAGATSWLGSTFSFTIHGNSFSGEIPEPGWGGYSIVAIDDPACGCTTPGMINYSASAVYDDGTCETNSPGSSCLNPLPIAMNSGVIVDVENEPVTVIEENPGQYVSARDKWYSFVYEGGAVTIHAFGGDPVMLVKDGCGGNVYFYMDDLMVPNIYFSLNPMANLGCSDGLIKGQTYYIQTYNYDPSNNYSLLVSQSDFPGCTNPAASNYNACASIDDGSCDTCPADLDNSGVVNVTDLLQFVSAYGTSCN